MPGDGEADKLREPIAELRRLAQEAGRPAPEVVLADTLPLDDPGRARERLQQLADVGVTRFSLNLPYETASEFERLANTVSAPPGDSYAESRRPSACSSPRSRSTTRRAWINVASALIETGSNVSPRSSADLLDFHDADILRHHGEALLLEADRVLVGVGIGAEIARPGEPDMGRSFGLGRQRVGQPQA